MMHRVQVNQIIVQIAVISEMRMFSKHRRTISNFDSTKRNRNYEEERRQLLLKVRLFAVRLNPHGRIRWIGRNRVIRLGNNVKTPGSSEPLPLSDLAFRVLYQWKD
jgi:hypothetical protein